MPIGRRLPSERPRQRSTSRRTPTVELVVEAASAETLIAPTEVPQSTLK